MYKLIITLANRAGL